MKKFLTVLLIVLLALALLGVTCVFLFRYFVADRIMDKGGMENPDFLPAESNAAAGAAELPAAMHAQRKSKYSP